MPTTFTLTGVRRVAIGTSASAQGRDGVPELTRTAFDALSAAEWSVSNEPPFVPVHDYAQPLPKGDAWKACYGYDAAARTERAASGAVVYTFAVPADALTGTACNIAAVTGRVTGDRYLDAGVDCHVVLSASATPPSVADFLARTPDATLCATRSQTQPPNQRAGVTAELAVEPASAATAYVHVALLLHDYLGTRGAWIEGGALLEQGRVTVEFSRTVNENPPTVIPPASLFAVTGKHIVNYTTFNYTRLMSFYCCSTYAYYVNTSQQAAAADQQRLLPLFAAGAPVDKNACFFFKHGAESSFVRNPFCAFTQTEEEEYVFQLAAMAFHNPRRNIVGLTFRLKNIKTTEDSGVLRVGFVESDAELAEDDEVTGADHFFEIPWAEVFYEQGENLLGFMDKNVAKDSTVDVDITISKQPTKKFIYPIFIPYSGAIVASAGNGVPQWRIDSV